MPPPHTPIMRDATSLMCSTRPPLLHPMLMPSGQTTSALLNATVASGRKRKAGGTGGGAGGSAPSSPPFPPSHYALSLVDMVVMGYPVPVLDEVSGLMRAPEGYVASPGVSCWWQGARPSFG